MQMRVTKETSLGQPKQKHAQLANREPQPCSLCSGQLVMDAEGTALFCDACWERKWFLALERE